MAQVSYGLSRLADSVFKSLVLCSSSLESLCSNESLDYPSSSSLYNRSGQICIWGCFASTSLDRGFCHSQGTLQYTQIQSNHIITLTVNPISTIPALTNSYILQVMTNYLYHNRYKINKSALTYNPTRNVPTFNRGNDFRRTYDSRNNTNKTAPH